MQLAHTIDEGLSRFPSRFLEKVRVDDSHGCWVWTGAHDELGYGDYWHEGRTISAHRYALSLVAGESDLLVLHACDTPSCVNPAHLRYGTPAENVADMIERGRHVVPRGELHGRSKLSDAEVRAIRAMREAGVPVARIAAVFSVSTRHVYDICAGRFRSAADAVKIA